jgi:hypothetical protein
MPIKTFRGLIVDNTQDTIVLHTNDGSTGYRIVKFEIMPNNPFTQDYESFVQIFKTSQTVISGLADFSNQRLLATAMWSSRGSAESYPEDKHVIFDREIFNQDIYVTYQDTKSNDGMNYYIELEQVKLSLDENTVATLKDIRNTTTG